MSEEIQAALKLLTKEGYEIKPQKSQEERIAHLEEENLLLKVQLEQIALTIRSLSVSDAAIATISREVRHTIGTEMLESVRKEMMVLRNSGFGQIQPATKAQPVPQEEPEAQDVTQSA